MKKFKKLGIMLGLALCVVMGTNQVAHAQEIRMLYSNDGIQPRWSYIEAIGIGINFTDLGKAQCYTSLTAQRGDYQCTVESTLYRLNGGTWEKLKSWSHTGEGSAMVAEGYYVKKGYLYLLRSKCSVYNAAGTKLLESHTEDYQKEYK